MGKVAIVNINLAIPVPDDATEQEVGDIICNYELPHGYVSDSFEFVKVEEE